MYLRSLITYCETESVTIASCIYNVMHALRVRDPCEAEGKEGRGREGNTGVEDFVSESTSDPLTYSLTQFPTSPIIHSLTTLSMP